MPTTAFYTNQYFSTTLNVGGGIDNSQTTGIIVTSVSGLDITKPGIALINYADPLNTTIAEWVTYTSIDGSNELQGVVRGAEGFSAKSHDNGVSIAFPLSESHINNLATALSIGGVATNMAEGVLDEDDMASDSATKLATQQSIKAYVDANAGGDWKSLGQTLTYTSADDPTYVATVSGVDVTSTLSVGMKIRLSQSTGGTKYFIITKIAFSTDTTITLYGGTDYNLENEAISSPVYSSSKSPYGFPSDPDKWTASSSDTSSRSQSSPTIGTWYNLGSVTISIPIGLWNVEWQAIRRMTKGSSTVVDMSSTLSTGTTTESDAQFTEYMTLGGASGSLQLIVKGSRNKVLSLSSKTSYYLNAKTSTGADTIEHRGDLGATIIRARCAYL